MVDEIARIEYKLTGSELIALLFESELIKRTNQNLIESLEKAGFHMVYLIP